MFSFAQKKQGKMKFVNRIFMTYDLKFHMLICVAKTKQKWGLEIQYESLFVKKKIKRGTM